MREISSHLTGMAGVKEKELLSDWTIVHAEEEDPPGQNEESEQEEGDEEEEDEGEESGCGMEEEDDEVAIAKVDHLEDDVSSLGQKVQEIKDEDAESTDEKIGDAKVSKLSSQVRKRKGDETDLEDLSLASSPALPDDLPAIKPDVQYIHTPDQQLNRRLNLVVALTLACVIGLGIGHFLGLCTFATPGWSSRNMWEDNLSASQIVDRLLDENYQLSRDIEYLQQQNVGPIKISGKEGKQARDMRESLTKVIQENEELRMAIGRLQFSSLPDGDRLAFNAAIQENLNLRVTASKLLHLAPDIEGLKLSSTKLEDESTELKTQMSKMRFEEQPMPRELNAVARELDGLKSTIKEASKKKKPPPNIGNARTYVTYMTQVLSALSSLHEFDESSNFGKLDMAIDIFSEIAPTGSVKVGDGTSQKLKLAKTKFAGIKRSLGERWDQLKKLSHPSNIASIGKDTLTKMNRVIVNVVHKVKEIGLNSLLHRGKAEPERTLNAMAAGLGSLDVQFQRTWNSLEDEVTLDEDDELNQEPEQVPEEVEEPEEPIPEEAPAGDEEMEVEETPEREEDRGDEDGGEEDINREEEQGEEPEEDGEEGGSSSSRRERPRFRTSSDKKEEGKNKEAVHQEDSEEQEKYYKGMYNKKDDKKRKRRKGDDDDDSDAESDEDDDDDDDDDDRKNKKSGILRHWEKPMKKKYFREEGPRKNFIRRNDYRY